VGEEGDFLLLDDRALLAQCRVETYRSGGPGGQHRNKVSSAVRLHHGPTGLAVHADESRLQGENRRRALSRLRMAVACRVRRPVDPSAGPPPVVAGCLRAPKGGGPMRLEIGRRDARFWAVAAHLLDLLEASEGRLADAAERLGVSTGSLVRVLKADRHLLAAAQQLRARHGARPIA